MAGEIEITVRNNLLIERRDIHVYHHADQAGHIISCNNAIKRRIAPRGEMDYLHISVDRGPGMLNHKCVLDLPSFLDFRFSLTTAREVTLNHTGKRILLSVPPGPPMWELKTSLPPEYPVDQSLPGDYITINDGE